MFNTFNFHFNNYNPKNIQQPEPQHWNAAINISPTTNILQFPVRPNPNLNNLHPELNCSDFIFIVHSHPDCLFLVANKNRWQDGNVQVIIDVCVLIFFLLHVLLYFDEKFYEWMKFPYLKWHRKIVSVEIVYDLLCIMVAIYAVILTNKTVKQRMIQLFFIGKVYKLIKFDIKCMYIVVGTWFYSIYKIIRTLLILAMVISYVGSLFYGVAYYLYTQQIDLDLLWIVDTEAINQLVQQQFQVQLQYSMYWALGTASTAAYGDISASQPTLIFINILALAFEGFLFGFYLNSMHSIPNQSKQKQSNLLQQFDSFQHHASNRKISKKLYLQILCSLQYSSNQKRKLNQIQKFLPKKFLQQIKYSIYRKMLNNPIFFNVIQFQMKLSQYVLETVSQMGQDVYDYKGVGRDDLIYIKEGQVSTYIEGQLERESRDGKVEGDCFGIFSFVTGLFIPQKAICTDYCFLYRIPRQDYKKTLPYNLKVQFETLQNRAFHYQGAHLKRDPITKFIQSISQSQSKLILLYNPQQKQRKVLKKYAEQTQQRQSFLRTYNTKIQSVVTKTNKLYVPVCNIKFKNAETQTDKEQVACFQVVQLWGKIWNQQKEYRYY